MESPRGCATTTHGGDATTHASPLHMVQPARRTALNRVFAAVYTCGILALLYHHAQILVNSKSIPSFSISLILLVSDLVLAFMWFATQSFRMRPIHRKEFPENLEKVVKTSDFPSLDVFICTADPYKEPPISVVNTALSVMAYDYPTEKISVYVSDDGGSALTLFAFMEASKFASHWLPFCRKNNLMERSPDEYFASNHSWRSHPETEDIKMMYESMKVKVEHVVQRGKVEDDYINSDHDRMIFDKWTDEFTHQDHPTVVQVLLENSKDKDITGHVMPNLIYVSRQKSKTSPHHFKAGALNVLLRVSAIMTNAPIILTIDCDMYSNDPRTPLRALCYVFDPEIRPKLGYVQFPQRFHGLNKNDIYGCEFKRLFQINPFGMDGLVGPNYLGTGCFFCRRVFFGGPSTLVLPEISELGPDHIVDKPIQAQPILSLAHRVAGCNYENTTNWGYKIGFRYGTLVEDCYTGYHMKCEGWKSIFCYPDRVAFYGYAPISLVDVLNHNKRCAIGLLEMAFCKYSPITFGTRTMGPLMGFAYAYYAFWPIFSIPITIYAFLPQLALLNGISIFPKVSEPWFFLYAFLFLSSYGQDCLDFVLEGGTFQRWWNDQRMWMIRGVSCLLFGSIEYLLKSLGISTHGFNVTNKIRDDEQSKRYDQEIFEFGVHSPMFLMLTTAAVINLASFVQGFLEVFRGNKLEGLFVQMFIAGFVVMNCQPIYKAMVLRNDSGKMPIETTIIATFLAWALYMVASLILE